MRTMENPAPSPREERRGGAGVLWVMILILMGSFLLDIARPSLALLLERPDLGFDFQLNYGIPFGWSHKFEFSRVKESLPEGSVGLDFLSSDLYLKCAGPGLKIYKTFCQGDPYVRSYMYPPLMARAMMWVLAFTTLRAAGLWSLSLVAGIGILSFGLLLFFRKWFGESKGFLSREAALLAFFIVLSYPAVFAYERGNNDLFILIMYTVCSVCFVQKRFFWCGFTALIAFLLKMHPLPFLLTVLGGSLAAGSATLIRRGKVSTPGFAVFCLGGVIAGALIFLMPLLTEYHYYMTVHYPKFTAGWSEWKGAPSINHGFRFAYGPLGVVLGAILFGTSFFAYALQSTRAFAGPKYDVGAHRQALLSLLYVAGVGTYLTYHTESYDYNLILFLPLFCFLAIFAAAEKSRLLRTGAFLLMAGYAIPRWTSQLFQMSENWFFSLPLLFETLGLLLLAVYQVLALRPKKGASPA